MKISIIFEDGQMTPMEVPVLHAGIGGSLAFAQAGRGTGGALLLKLRRRVLRKWSRLFVPLERHPGKMANAI
jgi:hypothetical protein